jgi:prepilin-type N-terminal cleavage/methylation domain-containing protein
MVYNQMKYQTRKSQKVFVNRNNKNLGFSLLELTIVLTIMAIVVSFGIFSMSKIISARGDNKVVEDMQKVKESIERFRVQNGRYPCPASLIAGDGQEVKEGTHNACYNSTATKTVAVDGFARVKPTGGTADEASVIIGAVPFAALGIDPKYGVDKWGNKYVYAVTEVLAADINNTTPSDTNDDAVLAVPTKLRGAVAIKDAFSSADIAKYDSNPDLNKAANYLLISHGSDGNGAFNAKGSTQGTCVTTGIGEREKENCNYTDANFAVSGTLNTTTDNNYFYDLLIWDSVFSNNLSVTGSQDIRDGLKISGTDVPTGKATFEVVKGESTLNCTKGDKCANPATQYALKVQGSTNLKCADIAGGCDGASEYALNVDGKTNLGGALKVSGRSEFNSTTVLPNQTEATLCNSSNEGAARYNNATKTLEVCDGANWGSTYPRGTLAGWCWFGTLIYFWPSINVFCQCDSGWMPVLMSVKTNGFFGVDTYLWTCMKQ